MRSPKILNVGVIGTGSFAEICHIPGINSHPSAEVVAICGRNLSAAKHLAEKFGIKKVTTDFKGFCADPMIDAITIATANVAHAEHAIEALKHGKHVLCEKPLAISVREAKEMTRIACSSGKVHQVAFTFRYNYGIRELRRRIAAGDIGRPFFARVQYDRWDGLRMNNEINIGLRQKMESSAHSILFDLGSHLFDIVDHVMGRIDSVIGYTHMIPSCDAEYGTSQIHNSESNDMVNAWIRHSNGVRGQFFISRITPPFAQLGYLEVIGDQGALKAALSRGGVDSLMGCTPTMAGWKKLQIEQEAYDGKPHALTLMMHSFVDACICGHIDSSIDASFNEGLAAQIAMSALLESERTGHWTALERCS